MDYIYANIDNLTLEELCPNLKPENIRLGVEIKIGNLEPIIGTLIPKDDELESTQEK